MAHPHAEARSEHRARAHGLIGKTGNCSMRARGGRVYSDEAEDARMIERGVHEHESAMHKGEPKTKLKFGSGHADGEKGRHHLAKRARGGGLHKGKSTKVNVIVAPQGGGGQDAMAAHQAGMQQGAALGARAAAQKMAGPQMAPGAGPPAPQPAPMGGMPGGGARPPIGMNPGMMRKRGGKVEMDAGSGGGQGRIEKMRDYGKGGFEPKSRES